MPKLLGWPVSVEGGEDPEPLAVRIAAGMLGVTPEGIDDDVRDAIGEQVGVTGNRG